MQPKLRSLLIPVLVTVFTLLSTLVTGQTAPAFETAHLSSTIYTSGSGDFIVPAGVTRLTVVVRGGGGGGGSNSTLSDGAGGGGGGGVAKVVDYVVTPGQVIPYSVGIAGVGGTSGNSGQPGGQSFFGSSTLLFANGGNGGAGKSSGTLPGTGGSGGTAGGTIIPAPIAYTGGSGGTGRDNNIGTGGGGGSSAGISGNGNNGADGGGTAGVGGIAPIGGFAGGAGGNSDQSGINGNPPGGGGGGSGDEVVSPIPMGGTGGAGIIEITWVTPSCTDVGITSSTADESPICSNATTTLTANGVVGTNSIVTWWSATGGTGTNYGSGFTLSNAGPGTYYARVTGDCGAAVEATVTVASKTDAGITSATADASPICSDATTTLTANGVVGTNAVVTWWSATGGTGTNYGTGLTLSNAGPGTYYAKVTGDCGAALEASVTVISKTDVGITSASADASPICSDATTTLTANGVAGTNAVVTWWSATGGTGTNYGTGLTLSTASPGTYYARVTGDCGAAVEASVTVSVTPAAAVTSVTGPLSSLCPAGTTTFTANEVVLGGGTGSWSSSNELIATVNELGLVTAVAEGTANIIFTVTGGCNGTPTAQKSITVKALTVITGYFINSVNVSVKEITLTYGCTSPVLGVTATGDGFLTYRWYVNTSNSNTGGTPVSIFSNYTPPVSDVGTYYYYAEVTGGCGSVKSDVFKVVIVPQPAGADLEGKAYYTGPGFVWTPTSSSNTATVTLSAFVKNAGNEDCGDIATARVTFQVKSSAASSWTNIPSATNLPVSYVDPNNPGKGGTAAAIVQLSIPTNSSTEIFDIRVIVGGNYRNSLVNDNENTGINILSISQLIVGKLIPGGNIGGGARLLNLNSTGFVKGSLLHRAEACFGVEYALKGKQVSSPKGKVTIRVYSYYDRYGNLTPGVLHTYVIKSNAIASLAITSPVATFTSKANIAEETLLGLEPIEGNCTMIVDLGDYSNTGLSNILDKVGVTIHRNSGGIWYSNNWVVSKTVMTNIFEGDVVVSGTTSAGARFAADYVIGGKTTNPALQKSDAGKRQTINLPLSVTVRPNPSIDKFTFVITGGTKEPVLLRVSDAGGRVIGTQQKYDGETIQLGSNFKPGTYIAEVMQGTVRRQVRLIKL